MACLLNSESRRLYSWWWDSHISPKNSKWLQENLTDMDAKVKSMIKLIEEDADSFARRAEMYYKKRPELMKLVEEFYRAYRALAERYDHATGELRHAQRTLQAAFPNQEPFDPPEDVEDSQNHQKSASFGLEKVRMLLEGKLMKGEFDGNDEKDETETRKLEAAECEIENLKKALADILTEKESLLAQYEQSLERFSNADGELIRAMERSRILDEKATDAEKEVRMLKENLRVLKAEKDVGLSKQMEYLETISDLEEKLTLAKEEAKRAVDAESEARDLTNKLARLESENDAGLLQYGRCLDRISVLEKKIVVTEANAKVFSEQAKKSELEVEKLKTDLSELNEEKEALRVLYSECLEKSYKLELDLASSQDDVQRLTDEILMSTEKLRNVEEICVRLENSNRSLKIEASELAKKIISKDQELSNKQVEFENLQISVKNEHTHCVQVEAALQTLQSLYTRSQEEQRNLATELRNSLQMLKDLDICKSGLEEEMKRVNDENTRLNEVNASSAVMIRNSELEFAGLKETKERLEEEVAVQLGQCSAMQNEIFNLKEEMKELNTSYKAITSQLELVGLNPESIGLSVKELQEENSRLISEKDGESENLKKLTESLIDVTNELEGSKHKIEELESSCELLHGENSALVLEKTILLSQLHVVTVNLQKLFDQSSVLENSLSTANSELKQLREKSKNLEDLCELLNNEKTNLVAERGILVLQLESVHQRLQTLEDRFMQFEERYGGLEKQNEMGKSQIQELISSLEIEKQERENYMLTNQTRIDDLENRVLRLHEDSKSRNQEFQEELDKAVIAQFENFMLHKFIKDIEEKNYSLVVENEKHVSASKLADKLISELETEILDQQVEEELLLVEVENLRFGIHQVFLSLEIGFGFNDKHENQKISVEEIIDNIKDMKRMILKQEDDKQRLLIENNVILSQLEQLKFDFQESEAKIDALENNGMNLKNEVESLREVNGNLELELDMLHEELEEQKNIEENLTSELQEVKNDFELWDAEATSFIFDLQISNTRDILFENKVHELTGVCESLEGETASKDLEIEEMKRKVNGMESEIEGLRSQLHAYTPVIGSLKENMTSLEKNYLAIANLIVPVTRKPKDLNIMGSRKSLEPNGISELIEFQNRIAALEKVIAEDINTVARCEAVEIDIKRKSVSEEDKKQMKPEKLHGKRYLTLDNLNITKMKPEISEVRKGVLIRDIPLDQSSESSPSANSRSRSRRGYSRTDDMMMEQLQIAHEVHKIYKTEKNSRKLPYEPQIEDLGVDKLEVPEIAPNQENKKGKLLQRLVGDARKLSNLEITVKDLAKRLETGKKGKKGTGVDLEVVKEQLKGAKETILQLVNVNVESTGSMEKNPTWAEEEGVWKESEKIKRVQVQIQQIQCVLLKLEDEKKGKGKSRFSRTKSVILRKFVHHGRSNSGRRRRLCGCFTPSAAKGELIKM